MISWEIARKEIDKEIIRGTDINTARSTLRVILGTNYPCWKHDYNGETGFLVKISNSESNNIEIPWSMLEKAFSSLCSADGYSRKWFVKAYPKQCKEHGCHVLVIGRIFEIAGLAYRCDKTYLLNTKSAN